MSSAGGSGGGGGGGGSLLGCGLIGVLGLIICCGPGVAWGWWYYGLNAVVYHATATTTVQAAVVEQTSGCGDGGLVLLALVMILIGAVISRLGRRRPAQQP